MKTPDLMDIANIAPANEREVPIYLPNGEDSGIRVWVMSADDPRMSIYTRRMMDRQNEARRKNKIIKAEQQEEEMIRLVARAVTRWDWGMRKYNGVIPDFSFEKVVEVIGNPNLRWFFSQINDAVGDDKGFFSDLKTN